MSFSVAELRKRIEQGEDLEAISSSLISPAEQGLLRCCAVVRTFDEDLVDNYFRPQVAGADKESVPFSALTGLDFVQRVPRTDGVYSLQPSSQKKYYDSWWEVSGQSFPRSEVPSALRELSLKLLEHYSTIGEAGKLDALAQQVFVDKEKACALFEELYEHADNAFDLARCRDIINVLRGLENVLGPELAKQLNDRDRYLQSRSLWATEYYQTVSYYERTELSTELESFLVNNRKPDPDKKWILHLHAPGGMGKTMFVRWLIARRCVPLPDTIPCARVDFDFVDRNTASQHRWRLFLDLARELEVQIPGNFFHSLISKFSDYELILEHQQTQQTTSQTPTQLPPREKLEEEMRYLFGNALRDAKLDEPVILIFDTLEEVILYHPDDLLEIVRQVKELRKTAPNLLLVLSGRYDLSETGAETETRLPQFNVEFGKFLHTVRVRPFEDEEAIGFLQLRGLTKDRPLEIVVERSEGNPFKLALFADILLDDPEIKEETIRSYPSADLLYLIERVLARIPNKTLHWLLRYGVVPRKLTLSFVKEVMKDYLIRAVSGDVSHDDPTRYESLTAKAQQTVREKKIFDKKIVESPEQELHPDMLWAELQKYASKFAWVTIEASDPYTAVFHGDVVNPMRRWLEKEPVYKLLHRDAIAHFEKKAQTDPQSWSKWMRNAVYHKFQLEGAEAAEYWRQLMANEEADPARRRELASEIIGSEYVEDNFQPRLLLDKTEIITRATLADAYYQLARASVDLANTQNVPASDQLWLDAENDLQKSELIQRELPKPVVPNAALTSIHAAIMVTKGHFDQAISILMEALEHEPDDSIRLVLELGLAHACYVSGDRQKAAFYWESSLQRMEQLGFAPPQTIPLRRSLARLYRDQFDLEASARELLKALDAVEQKYKKTRAELLNELVDLYFDMGQFWRARERFDEIRDLGADSNPPITALRYLNQTVRFLMAVGDPRTAFSLRQDTRSITVSDLADADSAEARDVLDALTIEAVEQQGSLRRMLFEIETAREAFELARGRWREVGDSKAVKRCMLKKAELFLNAREIYQVSSILDEISRLSIAYDPEQWLEENLIRLDILHFTQEERELRRILEDLDDRAAKENWGPDLRAKLRLRTGSRRFSSQDQKAANKFFSDLTEELKQIRPASTRMLLLDSLCTYPSLRDLDYHVTEGLIQLFPLNGGDHDFSVHAPRLAELLRVIGRKDQAVSLLKDLIRNDAEHKPFQLRRVLLTLGRTSPQRGEMDELRRFVNMFLDDYKSFPTLCGATFIELAELSFATRDDTERLRLLDQAAEFLKIDGKDSQWTARLLALRGRLTIKENRNEALGHIARAIAIHELMGNKRMATTLKRFVSREDNGSSGSGAKVLAHDQEDVTVLPKTTIHIESNWTDSVTIHTIFPPGETITRRIPIEPDSLLDLLLAFETYENYSFKFLKVMVNEWVAACYGLGRILLDEKQAQKLETIASNDQQKPALRLIIGALQLSSAPWEMMVLPFQSDEPASISSTASFFYRSLNQDALGTLADVGWLQMVLLGTDFDVALGASVAQLKDALTTFQLNHRIPDHGRLDGLTRRTMKRALLKNEGHDRPRVLLLRPSIESQRATSRGHEVYGFSPEDWYSREGFSDVEVVEDPHVAKVEETLSDFEPDVVHIFPTMEESSSIGIYLDFGSGGTGIMPRRSTKKASPSRKGSSAASGDVQFLTLSALADMMRRKQQPDRPRPLLILDVLEPAGQTELFTQLFLRNAFAAQLYQLGAFESIIANGLAPAGLQEEMSRTLISHLGSFASVGETVNRLRRMTDLSSYTRLAPVGDQLGPLRDPSDRSYLSTVVATAGIALFTQDPDM